MRMMQTEEGKFSLLNQAMSSNESIGRPGVGSSDHEPIGCSMTFRIKGASLQNRPGISSD